MTDRHGIRITVALPVIDQVPERADAARNRQRILAAAGQILAERGVDGLSLDDVARLAGVGVGTVYRRFGDRAGLLSALLDERERRFQAAFLYGRPPLGPGAPAAERLRAFLHAFLDRIEDQRRLMVRLDADTAGSRFAWASYQVRHVHVANLLSEIHPAADAHYLADVLLSAVSPSLVDHYREQGGYSVERIKAGVNDLLDLVLPRGRAGT